MKKYYALLAVLLIAISARSQNPAAYFRLDIRYYVEDNEKYLGVSPELRNDAKGVLAKEITQYPRRFRYILLNKTKFQNRYEKLYPDTIKINNLYTKNLSADPLFMAYFSALSSPFMGKPKQRLTISVTEMMQVASRFFYCEGMKKDSTINTFVCINLNGLTNAFAKDYTLVEAFCFEAIFETYRTDGQPSQFMKNFKAYVKEGERKEKASFVSKESYVKKVRQYCFEKMATDAELKAALMRYYELNKQNLPFKLSFN